VLVADGCGGWQILRVLDSLQLTAYHKVATPGNWKQGGDCMVVPSVKPEEQDKVFPKVERSSS